ncbi:MAG: winged helix-turn-helix domain-containing protein [Methanoregula sp.]|uniref:helix-turn-helix transcriptional regulator n=1 Tax=Methanoregula sp. TaxID=2052170 RepID=UPI003BAFCDD3
MADLLCTICYSQKRKNLLILLKEGPKTWEEIKTVLEVTSTGMLPQIKILEDEKLVCKKGKKYALTELGELVAHFLEPLNKTLGVLEKEKKFWQNHDINALPKEFLLRIGELGNIQILESKDEQIYESHKEFRDILEHSTWVKGITHMVHPIYPDLFLSLAKKGIDTTLILTRNVFEIVEANYRPQITKWLEYDNAHLYVYDGEIKFSYITTEKYLSMTFFYSNGIFDTKRDLISVDPSAVKWGEDLFAYFRERSRSVKNLEDEINRSLHEKR